MVFTQYLVAGWQDVKKCRGGRETNIAKKHHLKHQNYLKLDTSSFYVFME